MTPLMAKIAFGSSILVIICATVLAVFAGGGIKIALVLIAVAAVAAAVYIALFVPISEPEAGRRRAA